MKESTIWVDPLLTVIIVIVIIIINACQQSLKVEGFASPAPMKWGEKGVKYSTSSISFLGTLYLIRLYLPLPTDLSLFLGAPFSRAYHLLIRLSIRSSRSLPQFFAGSAPMHVLLATPQPYMNAHSRSLSDSSRSS